MPDSLQHHGLQPTRLLCSWDFPGKDTGVGCHFLPQGVFPTQGLNLGLLNHRQILYWLSYKGSPCVYIKEYIYSFRFFSIILLQVTEYSFLAYIVGPYWLLYMLLSLQSCPTLCDPTDSSPPGSPVPGILQARTLEWVAISFSNAWKWKVKVRSLSRVWHSVTPWTAAYQAPPSMGFSRQEYWSGVVIYVNPNLLIYLIYPTFLLC